LPPWREHFRSDGDYFSFHEVQLLATRSAQLVRVGH
jgi:hypothetical protein